VLAAREGLPSQVALAIALAFVPYAAGVVRGDQVSVRFAMGLGFGLAAVAGAALVWAPPVLSDDVFRYLWDGRVLGQGLNPYRWVPDDPALAHLRDSLWERVNNPKVATIYPPGAQVLFVVADTVAHAPWSMKCMALAAHLGAVIPIRRLAEGSAAPSRAVLAWLLNPLALSASALDGHVDVFVGLALAASVAALLRARTGWAAALAGLASAIKLVGLLFVPLVGARRIRAGLLVAVLGALALAPLLSAGGGSGESSGLGHYARRWQGNAGGFALVHAPVHAGLRWAGEWTDSPEGHVRLESLRPVLRRLQGTALDPRAAVLGEKKAVPDVADFEVGFLSRLLARALVALGVFALAAALAWRRGSPLMCARWTLLVALLFAPQVHPWYLLWLLPLEVASGRFAGLVWSATVLVAYAPLDGWIAHRVWDPMPVARVLEYGWVVAAVLVEGWLVRRRKGTSRDPGH
jgi:hypothetical protein